MVPDAVSIEMLGIDTGLLSELFGKAEPSLGETADIGGGVSLTYQGKKVPPVALRGPVEDVVLLAASIPVGLGVNLLSDWLHDKLTSGKVIAVKIEGTTVRPDKAHIRRVMRDKRRRRSSLPDNAHIKPATHSKRRRRSS